MSPIGARATSVRTLAWERAGARCFVAFVRGSASGRRGEIGGVRLHELALLFLALLLRLEPLLRLLLLLVDALVEALDLPSQLRALLCFGVRHIRLQTSHPGSSPGLCDPAQYRARVEAVEHLPTA